MMWDLGLNQEASLMKKKHAPPPQALVLQGISWCRGPEAWPLRSGCYLQGQEVCLSVSLWERDSVSQSALTCTWLLSDDAVPLNLTDKA